MRTHAPALSGLPICGEASRWRGKRARPYAMADDPTCALCITAINGSPKLRAKRWIAHARAVMERWAASQEVNDAR